MWPLRRCRAEWKYRYIPIKSPPITHLSGKKTRYQCVTFHNEIRPRENNLILIPSGQTNKIILLWHKGSSWSWSYGSWTYNCVQSVHITTKLLSSITALDELFSIQHYVITFVGDLRQAGGFLQVLRFHPPIKLTTTI